MAKVLCEKIKHINKVADAIFKISIQSDYISLNAKPGQFVNIKCDHSLEHLLRRPISICRVNEYEKTFDIAFQVKGAGTQKLSCFECGGEIDLIGPLGKGFDISEQYNNIAVVGGGIGIFPLLFLLQKSKSPNKISFLGFRDSNGIAMLNDYKAFGEVHVSTQDGSFGTKGLVTDALREYLSGNKLDIVYACGPYNMMKEVSTICKTYKIPCQVSLEQRMGCGIGACLVCACKTISQNEEGWQYSHVCKDGPVFWSDNVNWE